ncbi:two-partner secretion domain-containing protein [Chlorogloea sp. CCALA 695]|uniref:two-partner secretion domain-containing protein n=1 Tax=Chlorogloea sp. CCALA 695 TaxID=2107693 RepID=UPI0013048973|nr:filamentous hemagglutinin N-terminal domain-containing protein [Chlorogloea sp. CCALA 695]
MIAKSWCSGCWQWAIGGLVGLSIGVGDGVLAQVIPDNTLGAENSVVTPNVDIQGIFSDRIDGGATRGANLFHSFQEFNVGEAGSVYFASPTGIENILTRVTGSNPSNILGRLGVVDGANLLLLNPNGIIYGSNAQLDVKGSFLASTASSFTFANGGDFSATNPQAPPLLAISVPLGLQYGNNPGNIQVQGSILQVNPGKTLALVGGSVSIDGGQLQALGGRIELGGVAGESTVGLTFNDSYIGLSFPISDSVPLSDVFLDNGTLVNVSASGDGNLIVNAQNLNMARGSGLRAGASWLVSSNNNPGIIEINATGAINLTDASFIENLVFDGAMGKGGDINITADSLTVNNSAQLRTDSFGRGDAGNLNIIARDYVTFDGIDSRAESVIASEAEGQGGTINITTPSLSISGGATLVSHTFGQGNAGDVIINATESVSLKGSSTGIGSQVFEQAVGNGGKINIITGNLSVTDGATLVANTSGQGNGGNINITTGNLSATDGATLVANTSGQGNAGDVIISATESVALEGSSTVIGSQVFKQAVGNGGQINITTGNLSVTDGATLVTNTDGQGSGGKINVTTGNLSASDGATLVANTSGQGNAGDVMISATESVSLEGSSTGIGSQVFEQAVGNGGQINITTGNLSASDGATLAANTFGQGNAGDVIINATESVALEGSFTSIGSQVFERAVGNGGKINITTGNLSASNGATLVTNTDGQGNAGDVTISATESVSLEGVGINTQVTGVGSQVLLSAEGNGGKIDITARSLTVTNGARLIASSSGQGNGGDVEIITRDTVSFDGVGSNGISSGVFSSVEVGSEGEGGDIRITTDTLNVSNGGVLDSQTQTNFKAGDLELNAQQSVNINQASLLAQSIDKSNGAGAAGNVTINTGNLTARNGTVTTSSQQSAGGSITITSAKIRLFGDSDITTNVNQGAGGGGNIDLKADSILAFDDSDILAFARDGKGGDITLNTPAFFGENYRPVLRGTNPDTVDNNNRVDINATGAVSGIVTIPDVSFIQNSLIELPENQIDTNSLLANSCIVRRNQPTRGSFTITGTGGLPQRPGDVQISSFPTVDVETLPTNDSTPATTNSNRSWQKGDPIVEPQGVYRLPNGKLVLSRECS